MPVLTNPTDVARETLKLMATRRIPPTPENYQRVYHEIAGTRPARDAAGREDPLLESVRQAVAANTSLPGLARVVRAMEDRDSTQLSAALVALATGKEGSARQDWGGLVRDVLRQLDARQTGSALARKKEGLERLLLNYGADPALYEKLQTLVRTWAELPAMGGTIEVDAGQPQPAGADAPIHALTRSEQAETIRQVRDLLAQTLESGVAPRLERFPELAEEARTLAQSARNARDGEFWAKFATQLRSFFFRLELRTESDGELLDALLRLLGLLVNNIGELVEDDQWLNGQLEVIRAVINEPLTTDRISEAERRIKEVIYKQAMLKHSLQEAKSGLKDLISLFVERLGEMSESTTDYHRKVGVYAGRIRTADDIQGLRTIVDELITDTRSMQVDMQRYRDEIVEARKYAEQADLKVRQLEAELQQVSEQVREDQLTGTLNRRGLDDAMQREMARAARKKSPLCVAVLDLDDFKRLNDTYGHQAGDEALVHLAKVVKKTLRPTDIVARYGGEEFVCVFSETDLLPTVAVMKRLQRELTKRFFLHNNERLLITFSAGVARWEGDETQESLIGRADKAMYQAKLQGKNRVIAAE